MIIRDYTLSELVDLALRVPEIGAVNFNILHVVLQSIIEESNLKFFKPSFNTQNPILAKTALIQAKLKAPPLRRSISEDGSSRIPKLKSTKSKTAKESTKKRADKIDKEKEAGIESDEEIVDSKCDEVVPSKSGNLVTSKCDDLVTSKPDKAVLSKSDEVIPSKSDEVIPSKSDEVIPLKSDEVVPSKLDEIVPTTPDEEFDFQSSDVSSRSDIEEKDAMSKAHRKPEEISTEEDDSPSNIAKETQLMSDMWRDTNINRRLDAVEEGIGRLSYVVDRLTDKLNDSSLDMQDTLQLLNPKMEFFDSFIKDAKNNFICREEFQEIIGRTLESTTDENVIRENLSKRMITETTSSREIEQLKILFARLKEDVKKIKKEFKEKGRQDEDKKIDTDEDKTDTDQDKKKYTDEDKKKDTDEEDTDKGKTYETSVTDKKRIDEMWKQLKNFNEKLKTAVEEAVESKRTSEEPISQVKAIRDIVDQMDTVKCKYESIETELKKKEKIIGNLQNSVDELQLVKAEKKDMARLLETKADKVELDKKVDRTEFVATVEDLGESIDGLVIKYTVMDGEWRAAVAAINKDFDNKLNIEDYNNMQQPIQNRVLGLMYGYKNIKDLVKSALFPDAAGVTKCISCGRPAELAGLKFKACGDGGDTLYALPQEPKPPTKKKVSDSGSDRGSEVTKTSTGLPGSQSGNESERYGDTVSGSTSRSFRNTTKTKEIDYSTLHAVLQKTRYCGGKHTLVSSQQKAKKFDELPFVEQQKQMVNLLGCDNSLHKGAMIPEGPEELAASFKDDDKEDLDEILKSCYDPFPDLPKDYKAPRYCGSSHTSTTPMQRGIRFAPLQVSEAPAKYVDLFGIGGGIFKGLETQPPAEHDNDSEEFSKDESGETFQQVHIVTLPCESIPKKMMKTQIISMAIPEHNLVQINSKILTKRKAGYKTKTSS